MPVVSKLQPPSVDQITDLNVCADLVHVFKEVLDVGDFGDDTTGDEMTVTMHTIMYNLGIVDYITIYRGHSLREVLALPVWEATLLTPVS